MSEEAYNRHFRDEYGSFTFRRKDSRDAFVRRCEEYGAQFTVHNYEIDGKWDSAIIKVHKDDIRPLKYLIKTSS
jgi:hypothetical protein